MSFSNLTGLVQDALKATLGESVTFKPLSGSEKTITGVYSEQFVEVDAASGASVATNRPNLLVKLVDLGQAPKKNDLMGIRGADYKIQEVQKDGEGGALLLLTKA